MKTGQNRFFFTKTRPLPQLLTLCRECSFCGSSAITDGILLTAAHCLVDTKVNGHTQEAHWAFIYFNEYETKIGSGDEDDKVELTSQSFKFHDDWGDISTMNNKPMLNNDIALIKYDKSKFPGYAKKVELAQQSDFDVLKDGDILSVYGWGLMENQGRKGSDDLRVGELDYLTEHTCNNEGFMRHKADYRVYSEKCRDNLAKKAKKSRKQLK